MKFVCTQKNLLRGLAAVSPLSSRNPQLPILQHALLAVSDGVLRCIGTDLEVGARAQVGGKAEREGACAVPARRLLEFVQQLPGMHPLTLAVVSGSLRVSTEGYSARFPTAPADDFPLLPERPDTEPVILEGRRLSTALTHTVFAAARDESRPEIRSVFVHGADGTVRLAATDSFRLAEHTLPAAGIKEFSLLLPLVAAQEFIRLFSEAEQVQVFAGPNHLVALGDGIELSSRLVDGSYPDYRQIIPDSSLTRGSVKREEFLRALKVLNVFLPRDSRRVTVQVRPGEGRLSLTVAGGADAGEGAVTVSFSGEGEDVEALYNISYLLDGITHLAGESCELRWRGAEDPFMLLPEGRKNNSLYLVMPIQV
ncbi:MAG: DNA polymerase III subunit beta [Candidatus Andersenbacteria bacterium CG10_big_fil_rev_8_21_14_0_10_54_11]|uniref:Beta sliding clamp n=1 Tax=Candidatus Andersenbacteria bacterium CG10_big_fil_rev_8_21_14_0_10_54_11 TaxID=1974485 RepID=A0A2M6X024_9BACT|nr:MAG: DNA polymerase III subunit beta [Candidatus Andersenbacteria bacterium CG10_big_fil_rev_8_21_14_0_10_54_11]